MRRLGEAAWAGLKVTMASGCLHIKSRRVELQLRGGAEGCQRVGEGGNRFAFATAALLHATWKFCVNNNATCRLKTAEQSKMQRETGGGAGEESRGC